MGSVPNYRKEIADRYPIRWFKCKLKPPKNTIGVMSYNKIFECKAQQNPKRAENCVILIVKNYVYVNRCLNKRISKEACKSYIKEYIGIEEEIARSKNKLSLHQLKWGDVITKM